MSEAQRLQESREIWDKEAPTFDNEPDHGLRDPSVYKAWQQLLSTYIPSSPSTILDIGCGTGTLCVLLSRLGHTLTGIDLSPAMVEQARIKAQGSGQQIEFSVMDAAYPQLSPKQYDVVLCRHILWSLPQPEDVLQRWAALLSPAGRFILIEGDWHTGAGIHSHQVVDALPKLMGNVEVVNLSDQPELWGGTVNDERYMVVADSGIKPETLH